MQGQARGRIHVAPVCMALDAGQQDAHSHLMAVGAVHGVGAVVGPAAGGVVSAQVSHI